MNPDAAKSIHKCYIHRLIGVNNSNNTILIILNWAVGMWAVGRERIWKKISDWLPHIFQLRVGSGTGPCKTLPWNTCITCIEIHGHKVSIRVHYNIPHWPEFSIFIICQASYKDWSTKTKHRLWLNTQINWLWSKRY